MPSAAIHIPCMNNAYLKACHEKAMAHNWHNSIWSMPRNSVKHVSCWLSVKKLTPDAILSSRKTQSVAWTPPNNSRMTRKLSMHLFAFFPNLTKILWMILLLEMIMWMTNLIKGKRYRNGVKYRVCLLQMIPVLVRIVRIVDLYVNCSALRHREMQLEVSQSSCMLQTT